uniref:Uncharacterized protein n=1 Tax=Anguilla anguilla TaxID=7936 RepID=A0A0E9QS98_ANGAN
MLCASCISRAEIRGTRTESGYALARLVKKLENFPLEGILYFLATKIAY